MTRFNAINIEQSSNFSQISLALTGAQMKNTCHKRELAAAKWPDSLQLTYNQAPASANQERCVQRRLEFVTYESSAEINDHIHGPKYTEPNSYCSMKLSAALSTDWSSLNNDLSALQHGMELTEEGERVFCGSAVLETRVYEPLHRCF